ncbi:unnamed protein product, partial [Iphiclides podalirius]
MLRAAHLSTLAPLSPPRPIAPTGAPADPRRQKKRERQMKLKPCQYRNRAGRGVEYVRATAPVDQPRAAAGARSRIESITGGPT